MRYVELLSPAKDVQIGKIAVLNGADAVYIGAPAFGARKAAANSIEDIAGLTEWAHRFFCRVFVTLNTILYDEELPEAEKMLKQLYRIGVDAVIIQDPGLLKLDLPPLALHASTQMHNYEPERIKFLDKLGFQRIVLARELSLEQIRQIRKETKAELEFFVHGALCVSLSGQCYLSENMFGRSANRGECAQPCRMKWSVKDSAGKKLVHNKYILSLKDLNLSASMADLVEAGIDSFKIEGRLKDADYVANITNYYHHILNGVISGNPDIKRVGSGRVDAGFQADPERTFNRCYTDYFLKGRQQGLVNKESPKSMGKRIGVVKQVKGNRLSILEEEEIHNGDGLCYLSGGELKGIKVNIAEKGSLISDKVVDASPGTVLYRNYDHRFVTGLQKQKTTRKIRIRLKAIAIDGHLKLSVTDEDGTETELISEDTFEKALAPKQSDRIIAQLSKWGETDFLCEKIEYEGEVLFIPAARLNALRREVAERLTEAREKRRPLLEVGTWNPFVPYKEDIDWHYNVVNRKSEQFYREHGAMHLEQGYEKNRGKGRELMQTRYCILYELGRCRKLQKNADLKFPLFLCNEQHSFRLEFDCAPCFMKVLSE